MGVGAADGDFLQSIAESLKGRFHGVLVLGGVASGAIIRGGAEFVFASAVANGTVVSVGGIDNVVSGGVAVPIPIINIADYNAPSPFAPVKEISGNVMI